MRAVGKIILGFPRHLETGNVRGVVAKLILRHGDKTMQVYNRAYCIDGIEYRYPMHNHEDGEMVTCIYCKEDVPGCDDCLVSPADDDSAWAQLATCHREDCEWIKTRAHHDA